MIGRLYWEAARYLNGEPVGRWTSEAPGRTGPALPWWRWLGLARHGWRVRVRRAKEVAR